MGFIPPSLYCFCIHLEVIGYLLPSLVAFESLAYVLLSSLYDMGWRCSAWAIP